MRVSEKDFLILRYLQWNGPLLEHPDYRKVLRSSNPERIIHGRGTVTLKNYQEDNGRPETLMVYRALNGNWKEYAAAFRFRVELLSSAFLEAVNEARESFESHPELCKEYLKDKEFKGTLLMPKLNSSLSYDIKFNSRGDGLLRRTYLQVGDSDCIVMFCNDDTLFVSNTMHTVELRGSDIIERKERDSLTNKLDYLDMNESLLVSYLCFLHFASVTEKMITQSGSRQARKLKPEDDINDTILPIRMMTVAYFTTVTRTEGYPRRGFFRWQACGKGMKEHRLTWIDATYVNGYTRKAQVISNT